MIRSKGEKTFDAFNVVFMIILAVIFVYPALLIVCASFTSADAITKYGYSVLIREFSLSSYHFIFQTQGLFFTSLKNSVIIAASGTASVVVTGALFAYAISRKQLLFKKFFVMYLVITLLFSGGTISHYMNIDSLGLMNTRLAIILPSAVNAWYIILMRNFFENIPAGLCESAQLEGAGNVTILFKIIIPLSFPIIATIILFSSVDLWNNWIGAQLFIDRAHEHLWPIQALVRQLETDFKSIVSSIGGGTSLGLNSEGIKAAAVVVSTLPIVILYPFLQRFFISGMLVGGVKE